MKEKISLPLGILDGLEKSIGLRLVHAREKAELSQAKLADLLEIDLSSLKSYEDGSCRTPPDVLAKCAAFLAVEVAWFFEGMCNSEVGILSRSEANMAELVCLADERQSRRDNQS
jgi:transcriptional regulator with XRE-family HTH domain